MSLKSKKNRLFESFIRLKLAQNGMFTQPQGFVSDGDLLSSSSELAKTNEPLSRQETLEEYEKIRFGLETIIIQMPSQVGGFLERIQERITPEQLTAKLASFEQNIKLHVV